MSRSHRKRLHSKERRTAKRYLRNRPDEVLEHAIEQASRFSIVRRLRVALMIALGSWAGAAGRWWRAWTQLPLLAWRGSRIVLGDVGRLAAVFARGVWREVFLWGLTRGALGPRLLIALMLWGGACIFQKAVKAAGGEGLVVLASSIVICGVLQLVARAGEEAAKANFNN